MVTTDSSRTPDAAAPAAPPRGAGPEAPAWLRDAAGRRGPLTAKQDRDRAALAHLSLALTAVGPLVVWLLYRDRGPFTAQESKEALNFSLAPTLVLLLLFFLSGIPHIGDLLAILGGLVWIALALYGVMGASHVAKGRPFRYPFNLRLLR
ncbi:DUF4870 domain-containing protein [Micrococcus flavus]|uniref:Putative Tic20 family protein n=1 Tax=Micrococcus flavus TaxID=384602 RepID=A0A4Y8WV18_9MICC|nr:DUF4870 domain-containing protein [Micrococcus flavus]MBB4882609.1 putative Tic20 family protein [Micrococcus flavus]TFH98867.1 DUF4870 domain-containing protein [Micrococcus flavus]GGK38802.1 hypothetical protein GCM10007073_01820 [Micrococcus flavus]